MLNNVKLVTKLIIAFIVLTAIIVGVGIIGYWGINTLMKDLDEMKSVRLPSIECLYIIHEAQTSIDSAENALLAQKLDEETRKAAYNRFEKAKNRADEAWKIYQGLPRSEDEEKAWKEFIPAWQKWWSDHELFVTLVKDYEKNPTEENYKKMINQALITNNISFDKTEKLLNEIIGMNKTISEKEHKAADNDINNIIITLITTIAVSIILSILISLFFINNINGILNSLFTETKKLIDGAIAGKLDIRSDTEKINFEFRPIVQGINETLDAVIGPLNVAAEYIDSISKGNLPSKITENYNGDFNIIKNNLNTCIDAISALIFDANTLSRAAVEGKLDTRAEVAKHQGDYRKIVQGVNDTLDAVIGPLNVAAEYFDRISKGDIPEKITDKYNGDFNEIKRNLNTCIDAISNLITNMKYMSDEHNKGDIDVIIPVDRFQGAYKIMAQGVNDMLGGHISGNKKAMACVTEFAKGNFEAPLEKFPGKKAFINDTIEELRKNLKALIGDANILSRAAVEGKLATRADASKHQGDYRKIVQGVNDTLDAVIGPLNVAADYVDKISKGNIPERITGNYNGDFNIIKNNLNTCIDAINALIGDANMLSRAAVEGKLATRADASKHFGDYRKIVQGVNDTLDAVIGPLNVAADYVDKISKGNIPEKITGNYNGDFNIIKNNLNTCIDAINALIVDANMLSRAAVEGKLATRADASKHFGDYRKIVQGVNDTLDAVIGTLNVAADYVDKISKGNIPAKITDKYNGDFNEIKNNLNICIDAINSLIKDSSLLSNAVLEGNLGISVDFTKHSGDYTKIIQESYKMVETFRFQIQEILEATNVLTSSSSQIMATTSQLASSSSETATAIAETTATIEEVRQTAEVASKKARNLSEYSKEATQISQIGRKATNETSEGMKNIKEQMESIAESIVQLSEQSQSIGEIISTVQDLAEQSNILAINASIEAVKAGEYGKSFSVVAQEVRNLAEQSKQSTTQIRAILQDIQKATSTAVMSTEQGNKVVDIGVTQATQAGEAITSLASSVIKASEGAIQIDTASQQQIVGMDQVVIAIRNIHQASTQNLESSKQLENAGKELNKLGQKLKDLVKIYKL